MKRYYSVKTEILAELLECFATQEEFIEFTHHLNGMTEEMLFINQLTVRNSEDSEVVTLMALKRLFILAIFVKENIEVLHELIRKVQYTEKDEISEEERKGLDCRW
jgi:tRNA C32,U32 (ribose-2'-O)-methylase TrmJ